MNKIKFATGQIITVRNIINKTINTEGIYKDVLEFRLFIEDGFSFDSVDELFNESSCRQIVIYNDENSYIHKGYCERISLSKVHEYNADSNTYSDVIIVVMAKRNALEEKVASLIHKVNMDRLVILGMYEALKRPNLYKDCIIDIYADLIIDRYSRFNKVPDNIKDEVKQKLIELEVNPSYYQE